MVIYMKKRIFVLTIIGIILDRISKIIVINKINLYESIKVIKNFFYLNHVRNDGAAFSILKGNTVPLIIVTIISLAFIGWTIYKEKKITKIEMISYSLLLAGIIGNFIDRLFYGYVIDFLSVIIFKYYFPVFNIADTFIVIGVIIIVICVLRGDNNESNS